MPQRKTEGNGKAANGSRVGELIIIGGHEDKENDPEILKTVAERVDGGVLLVATLASTEAVEMWKTYKKVFQQLGVKKVEHVDVDTRAESADDARWELPRRAGITFL